GGADATRAGCVSATGAALLGSSSPLLGAIAPLGPVVLGGLTRLDGVRDMGDDTANFDQSSRNFAFFTHNIVHITDKLDLTLGLRYTNETKKLDASFRNTNTVCPAQQTALLPYLSASSALFGGLITLACQGGSSSALNGLTLADERKESRFTGTAVVSYKPTDDLMVYASYSRGYKSGGFNLDRSAFKNPNPAQPLPIFPIGLGNAAYYADVLQFDEETVNAFEIGAKYSNGGFTANVAAFRQEFSNFQLNTFNGTFYLVQNINGCSTDLGGQDRDTSATTGVCAKDQVTPGLVSQGVEVELGLTPVRNLRFNLGMTYARTRYAAHLVGSDTGAVPLDPALRLLPGQHMS
ncbi:MAG: TonB-dependent receptor, partial [Burkholderiales bacterium]